MVTFGGLPLPHASAAQIETAWSESQLPMPGRNVAYRFDFARLGHTVQVSGEIRETAISAACAWIERLRRFNDNVARTLDLEDGETPTFTAKLIDPQYELRVGNWFSNAKESMRWNFREHNLYGGECSPNMAFDKKDSTRVRCGSTVASMGNLIMLKAFDRTSLNGKTIRVTWGADLGYSGAPFLACIYDGSYDVSSDTDFPSGSGWPAKGNDCLQYLFSHAGTFTETTDSAVVDVSGGNQDNVTVFLYTQDAWSGQQFRFWVNKVEILDGGVVIWFEDFTDSVTMQRTGTYGDYGYISTDAEVSGKYRVPFTVTFLEAS